MLLQGLGCGGPPYRGSRLPAAAKFPLKRKANVHRDRDGLSGRDLNYLVGLQHNRGELTEVW
jgi:hypothetical protein